MRADYFRLDVAGTMSCVVEKNDMTIGVNHCGVRHAERTLERGLVAPLVRSPFSHSWKFHVKRGCLSSCARASRANGAINPHVVLKRLPFRR